MTKKLIYSSLLAIMLIGCGGGDDTVIVDNGPVPETFFTLCVDGLILVLLFTSLYSILGFSKELRAFYQHINTKNFHTKFKG